MSDETRRLIVAMAAAFAIILAYQLIVAKFAPARPAPPQQTTTVAPAPTTSSAPATAERPLQAAPSATASAPSPGFAFTAAPLTPPVQLGGREGDGLRLELEARGASVAGLELYTRDPKGNFVYREVPHENQPYHLLWPVTDTSGTIHYSFATRSLRIEEQKQTYTLADLRWQLAQQEPERIVFTTDLRSTDNGTELIRLTKTYTLQPGKPVFNVELQVENAGAEPLTVLVEQDGPLGIREENAQTDYRKLLTTQWSDQRVTLNPVYTWDQLKKATLDPQTGHVTLLKPNNGPFAWTALTNKYFAVYTRPLPTSGTYADYIAAANGLVLTPDVPADQFVLTCHGDLLARMVTRPMPVAAHAALRFPFEIYAGPKDAQHLGKVNPAYAQGNGLDYQIVQSADISCRWCTFMWLQDLMVGLLHAIYAVVRNYGIAIFFLVLIVRGLLHPLSVWQQKNMFRMQESMARVQPRVDAVKERYANDKVKLNQEMMRVWSEEGINPAANVFSMLPMFIQMPILIALWSALNMDVSLRGAPFDGWWIKDLSVPDALINFAQPIPVPIVGWQIVSLNLLPILMGVSMFLQQKYMPKPQQQARMQARKKGGMTPEETMRQQQIMMYMTAVLFPIMLYKQPSGLNLYWMASNVVGIFESLRIRHQIELERQRRATEGPPKPKPPGRIARFLKHLVAQAEEIQKRADDLGDQGRKGKKKP